jgi:hypothetical protein
MGGIVLCLLKRRSISVRTQPSIGAPDGGSTSASAVELARLRERAWFPSEWSPEAHARGAFGMKPWVTDRSEVISSTFR